MLHDLFALTPILIISAFGIIILLIEVFLKEGSKDFLPLLTAGGLLLALVLTAVLWKGGEITFIKPYFSSMISLNQFALAFWGAILFFGFLVVLISHLYLREQDCEHGEFYSLILFSIVGMLVLAAANNMVTIFIGLETMSVAAYGLAGFRRKDMKSAEAALKYFLIGAFSTGFLLYGIALFYGLTGHFGLEDIWRRLPEAGQMHPSMTAIAFIMLLAGFGFKIAASPFHMWAPDVYEGSPTPITAFFATAVKAASFAALLKVIYTLIQHGALASLLLPWEDIVMFLSIVTMFTGNLIALYQKNIKRMLAYSSIAHAGYILIGLLAVYRYAEQDISIPTGSILFYIIAYSMANIGAFSIIVLLARKGDERVQIDDFGGMGFKHPVLSIALTTFLVSLAGFPPTAGFLGKFYIFKQAIGAGETFRPQLDGSNPYVWLVVIAVINSLISVYYYLRPVVAMYMKPGRGNLEALKSVSVYVTLAITLFLTLHMGIFPSRYMRWSDFSSRHIYSRQMQHELTTILNPSMKKITDVTAVRKDSTDVNKESRVEIDEKSSDDTATLRKEPIPDQRVAPKKVPFKDMKQIKPQFNPKVIKKIQLPDKPQNP
jgi:NADH-quinone oxidoreductase subunit N